jgi:hypothetical protein
VRVIKLNAWEPEVQRAVETARKDELSLIRKAALVKKKKGEKN